MLRQFFTKDAQTIQKAIDDYWNGRGPRIVARLAPGKEPVEVCAARNMRSNAFPFLGDALLDPLIEKHVLGTLRLQVQLEPGGKWYDVFACYKEQADDK